MKKLHYLLTACGLILSPLAHAQVGVWVEDTVRMLSFPGAGYNTDIYYSLPDGEVKRQTMADWHIAFGMGANDDYSVIANHAGAASFAAAVSVYSLGLPATGNFGNDLIADTVGKKTTPLYNSIQDWTMGAFNAYTDPSFGYPGTHYGWGYYDFANGGTEHNIKGDSIFLVTTPTGAYQVWIERFRAAGSAAVQGWEFHVANIDGSNRKDDTIHINPDYSNKLFAYYNLDTKTVIDREPDNDDWDFVFTKYMDNVSPTMLYPYVGILNNHKIKVAKLEDVDADTAEYRDYPMDSVTNSIGRGWKKSSYSNPGGAYDLDTVTYFIKSRDNSIYQLEVTYATTSGTGLADTAESCKIGFRKRLSVEAPVEPDPGSVAGISSNVTSFNVFPNPAQTKVNILVDVKERTDNAQLTIMDLSGRTLLNVNRQLNTGLNALAADVSGYPAGVYFVTVNGKGWTAQQKIIVQH